MTAICGSEDRTPTDAPCGCGPGTVGPEPQAQERIDAPWTDGVWTTTAGNVPRARTTLGVRDRLGTLRVRSGVGRANYRVPPGLYAVGSPTGDSTVLLSANYKLSFDRLRSATGSSWFRSSW